MQSLRQEQKSLILSRSKDEPPHRGMWFDRLTMSGLLPTLILSLSKDTLK